VRVPIRLVVADIDLPDCSGIELLRRLRSGAPHLRALALSAHTTEPHQLAARDAGFEHFLPKPFKFDILLHTIEQLMNGKPSQHRATLERGSDD
jgi:DNA-binding response OmpR family regulator